MSKTRVPRPTPLATFFYHGVLTGYGGTRWCSWLRHCATSRKVADSIPDGVIGIFHLHNPSGRTMALGLTQPLTDMSTRNTSWGVKVKPDHLHVPMVLKSGNLNLLKPSGPVQACNGIALPFTNRLHAPETQATSSETLIGAIPLCFQQYSNLFSQ